MSQRFPIELRLQSNLTPLPTRQSKPVSNGLITAAYLLVLGICEVAMTLPNRFLSRAIVMMRMLPLAFLLGDPCCHTAMQYFWWQSNTIDTPHTTLSSFSNLTYFESVSSPRTFRSRKKDLLAGRQAGRHNMCISDGVVCKKTRKANTRDFLTLWPGDIMFRKKTLAFVVCTANFPFKAYTISQR